MIVNVLSLNTTLQLNLHFELNILWVGSYLLRDNLDSIISNNIN
jgi:hypothetical protein